MNIIAIISIISISNTISITDINIMAVTPMISVSYSMTIIAMIPMISVAYSTSIMAIKPCDS